MSRNDNPFNFTPSEILEALGSIVGDGSSSNLSNNLNLLYGNSNSSALNAIQGYGQNLMSPGYWSDRASLNTSDIPSNLINLNFNSVVEEDEYLYGDSNSVTEVETPVREPSATSNVPTKKITTGWSDDEDPYGENSRTDYGTSDTKYKNTFSSSDFQNKFQETVKSEEIRNDCSSSAVKSEQKYVFQTDVLPPREETKSQCPIPETHIKAKSKFHVAAEMLKKQTAENTKLNSITSGENISPFSGISKNVPEIEHKFAQKDIKLEKSDSKFQKQVPKGVGISKKHLENIKDYIIRPQRKRGHPGEETGPEKYQRYESPRGFSPPRRPSPYGSSLSSYKHKSSHPSFESDSMKYGPGYPRRRSPSFEHEKQHSSKYSEGHKQYSPSPKRWSHDKSPDYRYRSRRSRDRSPRSYRNRSRSRSRRSSRSRSPDYHSSKHKTYDKKNSYKSIKTSKVSKKKKSKYSSPDSFCSILSSETSSDSSSSSSDQSSDKKKKSKKPPIKTASKVNKELDKEMTTLNSSKSENNKLSDDIKKLSEFLNVNEGNEDILKQIAHAFHLSEPQQKVMQYIEDQQPASAIPPQVVSNMQMPAIPTSEAYAYPTGPAAAPVHYVAPEMMNFSHHIMPQAAFPPPMMTPAPPTQYGPYLTVPVASTTDSHQYIASSSAPKGGNIRQSNLKVIPMTESLPAANTSSSNITIIPNDNLSLQQSSKPLHPSSNSSQKSTKRSSERDIKIAHEKEDKKNSNSFVKSSADNTSEQNRLLIIEKFKKMKTERSKACIKSTSASKDLDEMQRTMDKTFGKKISPSEKVIYTRCKNLFNISLDTASNYNKDARRLDEELNKFKAKLPTALQAEVVKIKIEPNKDELVTDEVYSCLDQGQHQCYECVIQFNTIKGYLDHIQSPEHKESMLQHNNSWKKDFIKEEKEETDPNKKSVLKAVKGIEFVKPFTGFYCSLCKEMAIDEYGIEQHVKSHQHCANYLNFLKNNPLYERKCLFKRYIHISISANHNRIREKEIKKQKDIERKKNNEAAEKKAKEILLSEKSKEVIVEELQEEDSEDFPVIKPSPTSSSQKIANIKLNLSEKDKLTAKHKSSQELEKQKFNKIYIGKAPNFKKYRSQNKSSHWSSEKEDASNKKESDRGTSSPNLEKAAKGIDSPKLKSSSSNKSETSSNLESTVQKMLKVVEEKKQQRVEQKKNQEAIAKKSREINRNIRSFDSPPPTTLSSKNKVNVSNSSNCKSVPLSEITLPEVSSVPSSNEQNTPQPMDIDNSQAVPSKPKTEEEKDFFLLGITKEDFQPLVVPVPPPASMVSYPNLYNVQTLPSNVSSSTTSTSGIDQTLKSLDFSIPPPNIAPSVPPPTMTPYQNSSQPISVYGNQNNSGMGQYPYPAHNQQMTQYANPPQVNLQPDFKTIPPPTHVFNTPPPMLPYSNTMGNMPATSQYSATSSLQYNTSYSNSYQPAAFSVPPNPTYSVASTVQNLAPPGSVSDNSFMNYNTNLSPVSRAPAYVQQSKVSPTLKKVGNLITIVPETSKFQSSECVIESKPVKYLENSSKNDVEKNQTEKTSNNTNDEEKSKIIKNSNDALNKSKLKQCVNKDINKMIIQKIVIDCVKKVENMLEKNMEVNNDIVLEKISNISSSTSNLNEVSKDSMHKSKAVLVPNAGNTKSDSKKSKHGQIDEIKKEIEDVSVLEEKNNSCIDKNIKKCVIPVIDIFDDNEETGIKVNKKQASPQKSLKADGIASLENSSKNTSSKTNEDSIFDSEDTLEQSNATNDTMVYEQEQSIKDCTSDFSFDETSKGNHKISEKPMEVNENISEACSDAEIKEDKCINMTDISLMIEGKTDDSSIEKNVQIESIKNDVPSATLQNKNNENKSEEISMEIDKKKESANNMEDNNLWDGVWNGLWNDDNVTEDSISNTEAILKQITEDESNTIPPPKLEENVDNSSIIENIQNKSMPSLAKYEKSLQNINAVPMLGSGAEEQTSSKCFPPESSNMKSEDAEMSDTYIVVMEEDDVNDSSTSKNDNDSENSENMKNTNLTDFSSDKDENILKGKKRIYGGRQRKKSKRGINWRAMKGKVESTTENKVSESSSLGLDSDNTILVKSDVDSLSNSSKAVEEETDDKDAVEIDNSQVVTRTLRQRKPVVQASKVSVKQKIKKNQKVAVKDDNSESMSMTEEKADVPACGSEDSNKKENELDESKPEIIEEKVHNLRQRRTVQENKSTKVLPKQKTKKDQKIAMKEDDDSESIPVLEEKTDVSADDQVIQEETNSEDKDVISAEDMSQSCISEDKTEEPKLTGSEDLEMETESLQTGTEDTEKKIKAPKSGTAKRRTGRKCAMKGADSSVGIKNSSDTEEYEED